MVNFELRSKHFMSYIAAEQLKQQTTLSDVPKRVEDELFANLFQLVNNELKADSDDAD